MASVPHTLRLPPLGKRTMAQLLAEARRAGMTPEGFAKRLVETSLSLRRQAERLTFAEIMGPVRKATGRVEEAEIIGLVEKARGARHGKNGTGKRR
jgi:hypothetical protein